jgi:hypothetical protein
VLLKNTLLTILKYTIAHAFPYSIQQHLPLDGIDSAQSNGCTCTIGQTPEYVTQHFVRASEILARGV